MLICTEHLEQLQNWTLDQRIKTRLEDTGFPRLSELGKCQHDNQLLEYVVSHFNPNTCGFEFGDTKLVFSLKDVLKITGLHITGKPVTGIDDDMIFWSNKYFGQDLNFKKQGSSLFKSSSKGDADTLYLPLLYNVGEIKDYAWGAAALAHLYCSMKNIKEKGIKHLHGIALSLQVFIFLRLKNIKDLRKLPSLNVANEQLPLIGDWSRHLEQFTLNKSKKVDYLDLINKITAKEVNYNPYDDIQFPDKEEYSTFELEKRVCCKSTLQQTYLINFNEVAFFQPHKFKKQYSNACVGDKHYKHKWKLYPRGGRKGKDWQERKNYRKYINHWNISCLAKRPQLERGQDFVMSDCIEDAGDNNEDGEETKIKETLGKWKQHVPILV
ncbi:unnamed protein product [Vicia faba]|uniref:Aminotransferase-like plant mobile domain-containing protein n=1 Tax=Vicia faba TaxID=3906 RepID=A0AAV1BDL4_VICFA|nr:unnamed protein product [Vicia faba]